MRKDLQRGVTPSFCTASFEWHAVCLLCCPSDSIHVHLVAQKKVRPIPILLHPLISRIPAYPAVISQLQSAPTVQSWCCDERSHAA